MFGSSSAINTGSLVSSVTTAPEWILSPIHEFMVFLTVQFTSVALLALAVALSFPVAPVELVTPLSLGVWTVFSLYPFTGTFSFGYGMVVRNEGLLYSTFSRDFSTVPLVTRAGAIYF